MINLIRRSKDPYSWSYHNDLIAARGNNLRYHVSLGVGAEFDVFLEKFYQNNHKNFSPIYFLSASETDSALPMIGIMTPEFSLLRVLEHSLAKEFISYIPWVYRETFFSMERLINQLIQPKALPEIYKTIEDIRWINHKIARRSMLEDIIQQLSLITVNEFWEAIPIEESLEKWVNKSSDQLKALMTGEVMSVRFLLPCNENFFIPAIIFWLQLLESILGYRYKYWKAYWTKHELLIMNGPHAPEEVMERLELPVFIDGKQASRVPLNLEADMSLITLLSCWGEALKF